MLLIDLFTYDLSPPSLPPFPTRRSSDLPVVTRVSTATLALESLAMMASSTASDIWSHILSGWPEVTDSDRKSTRLNSSHVAISYAVFCLQKINRTNHVLLVS